MSRAALRAQAMAFAAVALLTIAAVQPLSANVAGSATYSATNNGDGTYTYNLLLKNTGSDPIKTFWFAWLPGFANYYDFLANAPSSVGSPAGWTYQEENGYYGTSIDWMTSGAGLAGGASQGGFSFTSTDAPSYLLGNDSYFNYYKVTTSYVYGSKVGITDNYAGVPFGVFQAVPGPVPEPATLAAVVLAGLPLIAARGRRRV